MSYTPFPGSEFEEVGGENLRDCFFLWKEEVVSGWASHFLTDLGILGFLKLEDTLLHQIHPFSSPILQMVKLRLINKIGTSYLIDCCEIRYV